MEKEKLLGPQKAAVLLMAMGEEIASDIISKLDEKEVQILGNHMISLENIDSEIMDTVSKEFYENIKSGARGLAVSGKDFMKNALLKEMDPLKVADILKTMSPSLEEKGGGLETLKTLEPKTIVNFLKSEHPQTTAIILAHLDPSQGAEVIKLLPDKSRGEVVFRLATVEHVVPGVIKELNEALRIEFSAMGAMEGSKIGGITAAVEMLNQLDHNTESSIINDLEESHPDLAENIRNLMFVFSDLVKLDNPSLKQVLKEIPHQEFLLALKTATEPLLKKIYANMSKNAATTLKENLKVMPPQRLSSVEKAQQNILRVVKRLEEEGKITIGGIREKLV